MEKSSSQDINLLTQVIQLQNKLSDAVKQNSLYDVAGQDLCISYLHQIGTMLNDLTEQSKDYVSQHLDSSMLDIFRGIVEYERPVCSVETINDCILQVSRKGVKNAIFSRITQLSS